MKRIITLLLICFVYSFSFGQTVTKGSGAQVTVNNAHTFTQYTFRPPVYVDTAVANMAITLDSCGKIIFTYDGNKLWKRSCNPKVWVEIGGSGGGSTNTSVGTGYPLAITGTNDVKKIRDSTGIAIDSNVTNTLRITNTLPGKTTVLDSISDVASFAGLQTTNLVIKDTLRGGNFYEYDGTDAADNGMIFADALGRKWLRAINESPKINAAWYGFSPLETPTNNATYFEAARDFIYAHPNRVRILYIPPNKSIYRLSRQIKFTSAIWIEGDESADSIGIKQSTKLSWPMNTRGFFFQPYQSTFRAKLSNLNFETEFDYLPRDTTALIETRIRLDIYNVNISYASGYGIVYKAALGGDSTSNPIFGDCSYSEIHGTNINECLTAIYVEGADANHIKGFGINTQANVRYGIDDNSFLGCSWYSPSFSGNGNASLGGAATVVTYGGLYYQALPVHDTTLLGIGKRPDLHLTWWKEVTPRAADVWDTTLHYWSGGPFILRNPSGSSEIYSAYREGDQPVANIYNTRSKVDGGTDGAGTWGYGLEKTVLGSRYLQYDGIKLSTGNSTSPHFYLGPNDPPHPVNLYVEQPLGQPGILLDATDYPAILEFRTNQTGTTYYAKIYYGGAGRLSFSTYNTEILYLQPTEGLVPSYDNVLNFGTNTNRIKDIWALLSNGAGNKTIRWNTDGKFTLVDTATFSVGFGMLLQGTYPNYHFITDTNEVATKLYVKHYNDSSKAATLLSIRDTVWALTQSFRLGTSATRTTDVTLSNVTGFSANLLNGATYTFEAKLYTTSNVAGGVNYAIGGTATASSIIYEGLTTDAGLTTQSRAAAMATSVGNVTAVTAAYTVITGTIVCNATGSLTLQFAQNASNASASTILAGSTFIVTRIN